MAEKLVVGPINKGLRTDREPFIIDNDSFPTLVNSYQWRGRIKRKRGTEFLGRLNRFVSGIAGIQGATKSNPAILTAFNNFKVGESVFITGVVGMTELNGNTYTILAVTPGSITINVDSTGFTTYVSGGTAQEIITLALGSGNLFSDFSLGPNPTLVPGTISITDTVTGFIYTDPNMDGKLYNVTATITGATQANPCVLTAANDFPSVGSVFISGVQGMTQLNGNTYTIISRTPTTITINVDSTGFTPYTSGGVAGYSDTANITNATQSNPLVLTALNNFPGVGSVFITGVNGMTELNGNTYTIVSDNPTSITLSVDSTSFHPYITGGIASFFVLAGTVNYSTGAFTITGAGVDTVTAIFNYYPDLPVMGIRTAQVQPDLLLAPARTIVFDTVYSYEIANTLGADGEYLIYDVSFFKNPASTVFNLHTYTQKTVWTPVTWSGEDFQQFWTTNFSGAMWATNGKPGMQFQLMTAISIPFTFQLTITVPTNLNVVVGDWIFVNETGNPTVDQQTGFVVAVAQGLVTTTITATFPFANMSGAVTPGMVQYLTNLSPDNPGDGIRWFDGDPTGGGNYPPTQPFGWVNYSPPLSQGSFSINQTPNGQYYLVGATMIYPFRDFLLFVGPWIQGSGRSTSSTPIWLQDTVIFCANGTPYYTASFDNSTNPYSSAKIYNAMVVPVNQTAYPMVAWEDVTGFGGYISSGLAQPITTLVPNEDVLIFGYPKAFTRLIYTGNNLIPFLFYRINTELGASSTFSAITFDKGSFTTGNFGICLTTQVASQRVDLEIPDQVFKINFLNQGYERVCAGRDFLNEWVYITYPSNSVMWKFPNQTLMYNYRDNSWAIHNEAYTSYGLFYPITGDTWASKKIMWTEATDTWNASIPSVGNAELVGGNQQGFLLIRNNETGEGSSLFISNIDPVTGIVTSPDHCLNSDDPYSGASNYIVFENVLGPVTSGGIDINGRIFRVTDVMDANTFKTFPLIDGGSYLGGGTMKRAYVPFIQTKQFPLSWGESRKTIIGPQMYLFTRTTNGQITLNIYLSTDPSTVYNNPATNDGMVYSQLLYTCPESTNLGLTPSNVNLQQINQVSTNGSSSNNQSQIWHRMNTSLIGDTVQVGFTISDDQMLDPNFNNQFVELEFHAMTIDVRPGGYLA